MIGGTADGNPHSAAWKRRGWTVRVGYRSSGPRYDTRRDHFLLHEMKDARRAAGLTQRDMALLVGLDVQVVKRLEKGVGSTSTLVEVMRVLDLRLTGVGRGATLPEQLCANRLARSLSLRGAAARTGMSRATIAALERGVPVRTDSPLFHDRISADADIYLLRGRIRFLDPRGRAQPTPFSLMVLRFGTAPAQREAFAKAVPGFWLMRGSSGVRPAAHLARRLR